MVTAGYPCSCAPLGPAVPGPLVQWRARPVGPFHPLADDSLRVTADVIVAELSEPVRGDRYHDRVDVPGHIRSPGGRVVVGGVVDRLHAGRDGLADRHVVGIQL